MRFAGTWNKYSKKAILQLINIATYKALCLKFHAKVMNVFEQISNTIVDI